jgi:tetratricopeptide (TPR) repeat protein
VWLWNVFGDALYALERFPEAHEAYLNAARLETRDVRTNLNLGYSNAQLGNYQAALEAIARGLANDRMGIFRERLMEKQLQILTVVQAGQASEQEWLARRASRLASAGK